MKINRFRAIPFVVSSFFRGFCLVVLVLGMVNPFWQLLILTRRRFFLHRNSILLWGEEALLKPTSSTVQRKACCCLFLFPWKFTCLCLAGGTWLNNQLLQKRRIFVIWP